MRLFGRRAEPPVVRTCAVPGCDRPAITGDSPTAPCWPCLYRFGHAVASPEILTDGEVVMLAEAHGDVVELVTSHRPYRQRWVWLGEEAGKPE